MSIIGRTDAWMETQSGCRFNPSESNPEYTLQDLMRGVSRICRFNGQIKPEIDHYSVAEHMVHLTRWALENVADFRSRRLARPPGTKPANYLPPHLLREVRTLAMHDAQEGLLTDMTRPTKKLVPQFVELEEHFSARMAHRFGLLHPLPGWIMDLDSRILVDERAQVMSRTSHEWATDRLEPLGVELQFWSPGVAYMKYRELLLDLGMHEAS